MQLGIDVATKDKSKLIVRLARLKTTTSVVDGGQYSQDRNLSQVHIDTTWTEAELDDWLYSTKGIEYVGTFSRELRKAA